MILGLRGTGSFAVTGQRPENWREKILELYPNGKAPLTALLAMLKSEKTDDAIYHWFTRGLPAQRLQVNGARIATDTTITVHTTSDAADRAGAFSCKIGAMVLVESTGEIMRVTADPTSDTAIVVARGTAAGEIAAAAIADAAWLLIVGNANEEGGALPAAVSYNPAENNNFCQIFRAPLFMTRTAMKTRLRTGDQVKQAKKEALEILSIQKERAFIFGHRSVATGARGQPLRTTRGIVRWIETLASANSIDVGGSLSESGWDGHLEQVFRFGSVEKLALCGSTALRVLATMAKRGGIELTATAKDEAYGMNLVKYITPFGELLLKSHPLFNEHAVHRANILIVDPAHIVERYIDDVQFLKNRQTPGDDAQADEWLNEAGLELHHPRTHMWLRNITAFAP